MTTAIETPTATTTSTPSIVGTKIAFDCITTPGAYVCNATGHLLRISATWNPDMMHDWCNWSGNEPFWFTCVSVDPTCSIEECRASAEDIGISWSF